MQKPNWSQVEIQTVFLAHRISFVGLKGHDYVTIAPAGGMVALSYWELLWL